MPEDQSLYLLTWNQDFRFVADWVYLEPQKGKSAAKGMEIGDLALVYLHRPISQIVAIAKAKEESHLGTPEGDWADREQAYFCEYQPYLLGYPISLPGSTKTLREWWEKDTPYRSNRKIENQPAAKFLERRILKSEGVVKLDELFD